MAMAHNDSKHRCKRRNQWDCWVCLPTADLHPIHALAPSSKLTLGAAAKSHKTVSSTFILLPSLIGFLIEQKMLTFVAKRLGPFTLADKLRELELAIFRSLLLGVDKLPSKAQTTMSFTILQSLNNWASVKWPCSQWDIKEGMIPNKGAYMTSQRMRVCMKAHWLRAQEMRAWTLDIPIPPHVGSWELLSKSLS